MPAVTNIPGLPHATALNGTEQFWAVQNGLDVLVTAAQIVALTGGGGGGGGIGNLQPVFGVVIANGTNAPLVTSVGIAGQVLTSNGAGFAPTYQPAPSGTVAGGGTGLNILNPVGGVLIANGANPINISTAGTAGQVLTSNGTGNAPTFQNPSSSSGTVPNGGTGQSTLTAHAVLIGEGVSPVNFAPPAAAGTLLTSNGVSFDPSFQPLPTITVAGGGTGQVTLFNHGLLVGQGTSAVSSVSPGTSGQVLVSNGASADPTFQNLPTITVPSGGTGVTTLTAHGVLIGQGTSGIHVSSAGTAGQVLTSGGASADPTFQAIPIPSIDVPHGGTGVATLTNHGVVIGQGTAPVHITGTGTAGQVLTSNGASADPTFQSGTATYPPLPVPDMQTFFQTAANAGTSATWIWGDYVAAAPIVITNTVSSNDVHFDFQGAKVTPGFTDPTSSLFKIIIPNTVSTIGMSGFVMSNVTFLCVNASTGGGACLHGLELNVPLNTNAIYGAQMYSVHCVAAASDGLFIFGSVFELDIFGTNARDNFNGINVQNPTQGGGAGVISSINVWGGDLRTNTNVGFASTAVTAFQEAEGFYIHGTNFIVNGGPGVSAPAGAACIRDCHLENNCFSSGAGQITGAGLLLIYNCDAAFSFGGGIYLFESGGGGMVALDHCSSLNESLGTPSPIGHLLGSGSLWIENFDDFSHYVGVGGWTVNKYAVTSQTV